jgi:hypothetical protein
MKSGDLVIGLFIAIGCIGFYAWASDEKYPRDPWFFPLIFALIFQVSSTK